MWGEGFDDRGHLLDDLLIEADRYEEELEVPSFWDGYREDGVPVKEPDLDDGHAAIVLDDQWQDWSEAA